MAEYVKEYHMTGLRWNPKGGDLSQAKSSAPAPTQATKPAPKPTGTQERAGLFSELASIDTKKLRHVTKEMKTKNQPKQSQPVVVQSKPKPFAKQKRITGNPILELERDAKWIIENHDGNKEIKIDITSIKHTVYIYKCDNCVIQIKGKCNSISIGMILLLLFIQFVDNCIKTAVVFDSSVSSVEIVNCRDMKIQVTGTVPTIAIDKTDGIQVYLSKDSLNAEIITAKSSEMNICVPKDDEYEEMPVPEQFLTKYDPKTKKLITEMQQHG